MGQANGTDNEVGRLRTVLVHRPGPELQRITLRHQGGLLLRPAPWLGGARQEHDTFCQALREQGVEVLYLTELLQGVLEYQAARDDAIRLATAGPDLGEELRGQLRTHLDTLGPEELAQALVAGVTRQELRIGRGVVFELLGRQDFVLDPLPNLVFTRDASFWVGDRVALASLMGRRRREPELTRLVYAHHPLFAGTKDVYQPHLEHLDGGDVLLMAPGVVAVGVGRRTTPAATERLAGRLLDAGLARTVLAVPMAGHGMAVRLDTVCTVVDSDAVAMYPAAAYSLTAHSITQRPDGMRVSRPQPFLEAAALAMGIERLRVIDTGSDAPCGVNRWDVCGNVLAVGAGVAICHERNATANARLEDSGLTVIRVPGSELASLRGGPRCMSCAISREPVAAAGQAASDPHGYRTSRPLFRDSLAPDGADAPTGPVVVQAQPSAPRPAGPAAARRGLVFGPAAARRAPRMPAA